MNYPFDGEVLCAPDSFKGSLSAEEAAEALARGVREAWPDAPIRLMPLADGGEGSIAILHRSSGGALRSVDVEGPNGEPVIASYLMLDARTAVVEMAQASGLPLVPAGHLRPETASTYGTGQLIRDALEHGATHIIVCLGGSATTDGGAGMAEALGFRLLDAAGAGIPRGGTALSKLARIDSSGVDPNIKSARFTTATDVTNPLCGPSGAAAVYGPQKGSSLEAVQRLEAGLAQLARILRRDRQVDVMDAAGAGAAGGLGAGMLGFLHAAIESGAETLMDAAGLPEALRSAALCITGEGRIDAQSAMGKLIARLGKRCQRAGVPLIAIGGGVSPEAAPLLEKGITAILSATSQPGPPPSTAAEAAQRLQTAAANACRLVGAGAGMVGV